MPPEVGGHVETHPNICSMRVAQEAPAQGRKWVKDTPLLPNGLHSGENKVDIHLLKKAVCSLLVKRLLQVCQKLFWFKASQFSLRS